MALALVYLAERFFYRIFEFLRHWYVKSARLYSNFVVERLEQLDRVLAWRITFKNLFQPLYKDYSLVGYILGFIFRSGRLLIGAVVYLFAFFLAIAFYLVWILVPFFVVYQFFLNL